jgi:hypothetical protein
VSTLLYNFRELLTIFQGLHFERCQLRARPSIFILIAFPLETTVELCTSVEHADVYSGSKETLSRALKHITSVASFLQPLYTFQTQDSLQKSLEGSFIVSLKEKAKAMLSSKNNPYLGDFTEIFLRFKMDDQVIEEVTLRACQFPPRVWSVSQTLILWVFSLTSGQLLLSH